MATETENVVMTLEDFLSQKGIKISQCEKLNNIYREHFLIPEDAKEQSILHMQEYLKEHLGCSKTTSSKNSYVSGFVSTPNTDLFTIMISDPIHEEYKGYLEVGFQK